MGQNLGPTHSKIKTFLKNCLTSVHTKFEIRWVNTIPDNAPRQTNRCTDQKKCSAFPCPSPDFISGDNKPRIWYGRTSRSCVELYVLLWEYWVSVQSFCLCSLSYPWTFNNLHKQIIILHWGGHKVGHQLHAWVLFCMDKTWECFRALAGG